MGWLNKSNGDWNINDSYNCFPPPPFLSCQRGRRAAHATAFLCDRYRLLYFWQFFKALCLHWAKTGTAPEKVLMPIKREGQGSEQSGPIVRSAFCCLHLLSLPAFVLCLCPDQNPFDLLQTIGNIIHQRLLFPLSLSFSLPPSLSASVCHPFLYSLFCCCLFSVLLYSFCRLLRTNLYAKRWALTLLSSIPIFQSCFIRFPFVFSIRKPKAEQAFVSFDFLCSLSCKRAQNTIVRDYWRSLLEIELKEFVLINNNAILMKWKVVCVYKLYKIIWWNEYKKL